MTKEGQEDISVGISDIKLGDAEWKPAPDIELREPETKDEIALHSDLDWIFANGDEVLDMLYDSSVKALARCYGMDDLWEPGGEYVTAIENFVITVGRAFPYVRDGDKKGYLMACAEWKSRGN